jgi:flagellar hook-associated protein 2
MQGISFSGLGSGLDTQAIIAQLVRLERIPIQQIQAQREGEQSKLSLIGTLKGHVRDLQTQAEGLSKLAGFASFDVSASTEGVASFSASGSAVQGSHTLEVTNLAAVDRWAFDGVADPATQLATGPGESIDFDVAGTSYSISIDENASSLEEIVGAINGSSAGEVVEATIVNAGTAANPSHQLVLTSKNSGEANRIENIVNGVNGLSIDPTGPDGAGVSQSTNNITVGSNAIAVIDGLTVERESNEFSDVIAGVSINVQSIAGTETDPVRFTVEPNTVTIKKGLEDFVDAYNEVIDFINTQNSYDEESGSGGDLFGDNLLRTVRSEINKALFGLEQRQDTTLADISADTEGFTTLSVIGFDLESDGRLSIDSTKLDDKLSENLGALSDLFVDSDGFDNGGATVNTPEFYQDTTADAGIAAILDRAIERMFDTFEDVDENVRKGLFDTRTEGLQSNIKRYDKQIEAKEFRLTQFEANLVQRFANLEEVMGGLNAQGSALNAALLGLS